MTLSATFDKHPHIRYENLDHLFWGEFAYRVTIDIPLATRLRLRCANAVRRARDEILVSVISEAELIYRKKTGGFNFFFETRGEAETFIDDNAAQISAVVRPLHGSDINALIDRRVRLRDQPWFGRYNFVVTFGGRSWLEGCMTIAEVDAFVSETFFEDSDDTGMTDRARYRHSRHGKRRLYLRDESDVVLVRLSVEDEKIEKLEIAKIRSDEPENAV
jgi:hypothetical protein